MRLEDKVAALLIDIEAQLRTQQLWDSTAPDPQALLSEMPFCVDTLSLPQWLQFVLLPRLRVLISTSAQLPDNCAIAAMAEIWFQGNAYHGTNLIKLLQRLDELLEAGSMNRVSFPAV